MNIDLVFKEIAHLNGVTPDQMKRKGRRMEVIKAKRMLCGYLRNNTRMSYKSIGDYIASDHSTAVYHNKVHDQLHEMNTKGNYIDQEYVNQYQIVERLLKQHNLSRSVIARYLWVLDFNTGDVYRYNIDNANWNPESQVCQAFLCGKGHNTDKCTWMVGSDSDIKINPDRI